MFLNNEKVPEEIKREIKRKHCRNKNNENMTTQNLWDAAKAALRGKFKKYNLTSRKRKNIE